MKELLEGMCLIREWLERHDIDTHGLRVVLEFESEGMRRKALYSLRMEEEVRHYAPMQYTQTKPPTLTEYEIHGIKLAFKNANDAPAALDEFFRAIEETRKFKP